jgi:hypothetical protein
MNYLVAEPTLPVPINKRNKKIRPFGYGKMQKFLFPIYFSQGFFSTGVPL